MIVSSPTLVVFGLLSESRAAVVAMAVASWRASPTSSLVADQILPLEVSLEVSLNILPRDGGNKGEEEGVLICWCNGEMGKKCIGEIWCRGGVKRFERLKGARYQILCQKTKKD